MAETLVAIDRLTKSYGRHYANNQVSLTIAKGTIHALLGENGAGKSTLVKALYGSVQPDEGQIRWKGKEVHIRSPKDARELGIAMVFQHFSLFPALTVAENIALALPSSPPRRRLEALINETAQRWKLDVNPASLVGRLSVGEQQRVEILRALMVEPELLIMDEPTSVLTPGEAEDLFRVLRRLAGSGCTVIYITHKLDEVMAIAGTASILRQGRVIGSVEVADSSPAELAGMMVGERVSGKAKKNPPPRSGEIVLRVDGLTLDLPDHHRVDDISFEVKAGEILGIAGVAGNGQNELLALLSGEIRAGRPDAIRFMGEPVGHLSPERRRRIGIETVPEQRLGHAAVAEMTLTENTFLTRWFAASQPAKSPEAKSISALTKTIIHDFDVRCPSASPRADQLSGGNLQKFILGRALIAQPKIAIIAQPSWGIDIGAAQAIRQRLVTIAQQGVAVILISQDLDELLEISHRLAAINHGRLSQVLPTRSISAARIGLMMGGAHNNPEPIAKPA